MPSDYAELLRRPFKPEELEEALPHDNQIHILHRLSSVGSELSFRNSVRDSDSDAGDWQMQGVVLSSDLVVGSQYLRANMGCSFEEMLEKTRLAQESQEKCDYNPMILNNSFDSSSRDTRNPGTYNSVLSLMLSCLCSQ